jgi:apolipoprotein N-acyltransferase
MADLRALARPACSLAAGAACALAFAPYDVPLLAPPALAVLFLLWRDAPPAAAFRLGYLFGVGLFGAGVNWLHISINLFGGLSLVPAAAVTFVLIAYLALFPALAGWASARLRGDAATQLLLVTPALWVLSEWLRTWLFTGFPWLLAGYSQTGTILGALAPVTGVLGVSAAVAVAAGALALLQAAHGRKARIGALGWIGALLAAGWLADAVPWTRDTGTVRNVALVQGAVPLEIKWRPEFLQQSVERYVSLTARHWDNDVIVWPETAVPAFASQVPELLRRLGAEARRHGADFYAGFPTLDEAGERYFNSLLLLGPAPGMYHKRHLVPFGEFTPLAPLFRGFAELLAIPMSNFSPGRQPRPLLRGRNAAAGVSICYEDTFGNEVIQALPDADLLINVSNDGWFGDSAAPHQHLQMARMRARETGRYLLRATNSGISAVIGPDGDVRAQAPQFRPFVLTGRIALHTGLTPYARTGDRPVILLAGACMLAAWMRVRRAGAPPARDATG